MLEVTATGTVHVTVTKAGETLAVDLASLDPKGLAYLIEYGLKQSLNDAVAGCTEVPEAQGKATMRLDAIRAGTIGQRKVKARVVTDPVEAEAMRLAEERVRAAIKAKGLKVKAIERAKLEEMVRTVFESDREKLLGLARKNLEATSKGTLDIESLLAQGA